MTTQQTLTSVETAIGTFSTSIYRGYLPDNCKYFDREVKVQYDEILKTKILVYRLSDCHTVTVNRVKYKYVHAQVDTKRQAVWFFGTRDDDKDSLSTSAREKLTALTGKALLNHANANAATIRSNAKANFIDYVQEYFVRAAKQLEQQQQWFSEFVK